MAKLKNGYKMMYEKDPIISPATVRDIKATKDTPLLTDKTVVFKEYESEATITRGTFYKVYEKLVDDSIRLYGVKRDDSVVEFAVYSGDDELLIGRKKSVPPVPPVSWETYKHRITLPVYTAENGNDCVELTFENAILDTQETYEGVGGAQWYYNMVTHIIDLGTCSSDYQISGVTISQGTIWNFDGILTPNGLKEGQRVRLDLVDNSIIASNGGGAVNPNDGEFGGRYLYLGESDGTHLVTDTIVNKGE